MKNTNCPINLKNRLDRFKLTEAEAEVLFGRNWEKRLERPDQEFVNQEMSRICEKFCDDYEYRIKTYELYDKLYELIVYGSEFRSKIFHWDELKREDVEEGLKEVKGLLSEAKERYRKDYFDYLENKYYQILRISKDASIDEIKTAYRSLALACHPDKNHSKDAEITFKRINKAYEVLSDPVKRESYDKYGFIFE